MIFARQVGLPGRLRQATVGAQHAAPLSLARKQSKV